MPETDSRVAFFSGEVENDGLITVTADCADVISAAMCANGYPVIRRVRCESVCDRALEGLRLRVISDSGVIAPFARELDALPARADLELTDIDVTVNQSAFSEISELTRCSLFISVWRENVRL